MKINYLTTFAVTNETHKLPKLIFKSQGKQGKRSEIFQRPISKKRQKITHKLQ